MGCYNKLEEVNCSTKLVFTTNIFIRAQRAHQKWVVCTQLQVILALSVLSKYRQYWNESSSLKRNSLASTQHGIE